MRRVYVGYSTSVLYWLKHGMDAVDRANVVHVTSLSNAAYTLRHVEAAELESHGLETSTARGWPDRTHKGVRVKKPVPDGPAYHLLVPRGVDHNRMEGVDRHVWQSHIPNDSFFKLTQQVYVSTPEFSFLQLAGLLSQQQLILVGYWLCAKYRIREDGLTIPVEPITSVEKLGAYLDDAEGCYGARKARRALAWVVDNARSAQEVNSSMLASLPLRMGGYGFGKPVINARIDARDLDPSTLDREDRQFFEIDLYWPKKRVGLEYDGIDHLYPDQVRKDKRRLNCLLANDIRLLAVMYDQIADEDVRTRTMNQLAKLLGVPNREPEEEARNALAGLLYKNEFSL
ncbi:MAG: hypothetical protein J6S63_03265 [Atopobiaceae bacterium]|nr:hypothetical protein [Atopobiaceae bacterium]